MARIRCHVCVVAFETEDEFADHLRVMHPSVVEALETWADGDPVVREEFDDISVLDPEEG